MPATGQHQFPSPRASLSAALASAVIGTVVNGVVSVLWPVFPAWEYAGVGINAAVAIALWRRRRALVADERALTKARSFALKDIPTAGGAKPDAWRMPGVPHTMERRTFRTASPDGSRDGNRLCRVTVPQWRSRVVAIKEHCRCRHPDLYDLVLTWWKQAIVARAARDTFPGLHWKDLDAAARKQLSAACEAEFLDGIHIALRPACWAEQDDSRPSQQAYNDLRHRLRAAFPNRTEDADVPWIAQPRQSQVFVGRAFEWLGRHTTKWNVEQFRDIDALAGSRRQAVGDPRPFGLGWREAGDRFLDLRAFSPGMVVLGGSGFGKTRFLDSPLLTAIGNGDPVVIIDPKGDTRLINATVAAARRCGRGRDVQFFGLADADNPEVNTMNPLSGYLTPDELGSRIGAVIPPTKEEFFTQEAIKVGRIVAMLCHWLHRYLGLLAGDRLARRPPELLLWLHYCKLAGLDGADASRVDEGAARFAGIQRRLSEQGAAFVPADDVEHGLRRMWVCEQFHPAHWAPHYGHIRRYGIDHPHRLVAWAVRIAWFHLFADYPPYSDLESPLTMTRDTVVLDNTDTTAVTRIFELFKDHPLSDAADHSQAATIVTWRPLYRSKAPPQQRQAILAALTGIAEALEMQIKLSEMVRDDYDRRISSLPAPVMLLSTGGKRRLLCTPTPDITWDRIIAERKIVYLALGSQVDQAAADAVAKSFIMSCKAYLGRVQVERPQTPTPFWIFGDEMASWATAEWADIIDKGRSAGLHSVSASQSLAGFRAALKNADLVQHILANFAVKVQFSSQSEEDAKLFASMTGTTNIVSAQRSTGYHPGASANNTGAGNFTMNENWSWQEKTVPLVDHALLPKLPVGQCFISMPGKVLLCQVGLLDEADHDFLLELGIERGRGQAIVTGWGASTPAADDGALVGAGSSDEIGAEP